MKSIKSFFIYVFCIFVVGALTVFLLEQASSKTSSTQQSTKVAQGSISVTSEVSGFVEAEQMSHLSFPLTGSIETILKKEGDTVNEGEIIASLVQNSLLAEYNSALNNLKYLQSIKQELLRGPQSEARSVTQTNVELAADALVGVKSEQTQLVQSVYQKLLSSDLEATTEELWMDDIPPVITGSYQCEEQGLYTISIFKSDSQTGYSYRLSGLESGTFTAWVESPAPLGTCGLYVQFSDDEPYHNADWTVAIPNTRSDSYQTNQNSYLLALEQEKKAVSQAELALELAKNNELYSNADPTSEDLTQINAQIEQARSNLTFFEAQIDNYVVKAPFDGIITEINMKVGEVSSPTKTIHIVGDNQLSLKARIPEVDIKNISTGNNATVVFDASREESFVSKIGYISPTATIIDGVAYYEADLILTHTPDWIREGLNADIDILIEKKNDALVIPKQYTYTEDGQTYVFVKENGTVTKTFIETGIIGNDGYVEILNLAEGTNITLP